MPDPTAPDPVLPGIRPTPDDGRRLTGELAWDEDARPAKRVLVVPPADRKA